MSAQPYEVALNRSARRALAETLPLDVAIGVSDFITGPLGDNPRRVGGPLNAVPTTLVSNERATTSAVSSAEQGAAVIAHFAQIGPGGPTGSYLDTDGALPW